MPLPAAADQVVIHGYLLDEVTGLGDTGTIRSDPVPLTGQNPTRPLVLDAVAHAHIRTGPRTTVPRNTDGYYAILALSTNDPDLTAYGGRKITFPDGSTRTIEVPYSAQLVTVTSAMAAQITSLVVGNQVRAIWYDQAAGFTSPTPPASYYTAGQVDSKLADVITLIGVGGGGAEAALAQWAADPDALIVGTITRDANGAATSAPVVWPDDTPGTYTATTVSTAFPGAVDAYSITYGSPPTKTYTQPAVTRNAAGAVTTRPAITEA